MSSLRARGTASVQVEGTSTGTSHGQGSRQVPNLAADEAEAYSRDSSVDRYRAPPNTSYAEAAVYGLLIGDRALVRNLTPG